MSEISIFMAEAIDLLPAGIGHLCGAEFCGRTDFAANFDFHQFIDHAQSG